MSNTTIRIRRSATVATPTTLANGELAYSGNTLSDSLFVGVPGQSNAVTRIGGKKYGFLHNAATGNATHAAVEGGTLTANAVVITNANGFIDAFKTNSLYVGADGTSVYFDSTNNFSNGTTLGTASNTELASTWAIKNYVDEKITLTGAATQLDDLADVQFGSLVNNNIFVYDATNSKWENHSISGTANQVSVSFSDQDITIGLTSNISISGTFTAGSLVGNGASITSVNAATLNGNTTSDILTTAQGYADDAYANAIAYSGTADTAYANAVAYANAAAANAYANATSYADGVASDAYANAILIAAGYADDAYANAIAYSGTADTAYSNAVAFAANASNISSGTLNTARLPAVANVVTAVNVGANVNLTTSGISVGNSTVNTAITGSSVAIDGTLTAGNTTISGTLSGGATTLDSVSVATGAFVVNSTAIYLNDDTYATGHIIPGANATYDLGTANERFRDLYLSGTSLYLDNVILEAANGALTTNNIVVQTALTVNSLASFTGNVEFNGAVVTSILPGSNNTYNLGNNTSMFAEVHTANLHANEGYFYGDVQVQGDLVVTGNVVTVNVSSVIVQDPMIYLAGNNYASDLVDIGFVGNYNDGVTNRHAGVVRHAATDSFYIFKNYTPEPDSNVIDIDDASFRLADVYAYLNSGALVSNSSAVTITANSTVSVNITANTLSLIGALEVGSGGTGRSSLTNNAIVVGNGTGQVALVSSSTEGHVLQINADGAPTFGALDGGTF